MITAVHSKAGLGLERIGAGLSETTKQRIVRALWGPLVFDWIVTLFSLGYGVTTVVISTSAAHFRVLSSPASTLFKAYVTVYGASMVLASVIGMYGLLRLRKSLRMQSSYLLVGAYAWLVVFYLSAVPLPWMAVYVFGFHAGMEAIVYLRTATDPRHIWQG